MEIIPMRSEKWDNVKFVLIFLVVLGHIADIYAGTSFATGCLRFVIYTFHMPLFLFISGLFSKRHIREKRWNVIFSYLLLFLFIKIVIYAAKWAAYGENPGFSLLKTASVPWYAFCLFAFCLITMVADKFDSRWVLAVSVIVACIAGYDNKIGDFLCLSRILVYYPFFFAGFIADRSKVVEILSRRKMKILALLIVAAVITVTIVFYDDINFMKFVFTGRNSYAHILGKSVAYAFVYRLIAYGVSALMCGAVIALTPEKSPGSFMAKTGERSVQIYALHFPLKILFFKFVNDAFGLEAYFTSYLIVYELLVSVALTAVCALPFWGPIFTKLLKFPRKKA